MKPPQLPQIQPTPNNPMAPTFRNPLSGSIAAGPTSGGMTMNPGAPAPQFQPGGAGAPPPALTGAAGAISGGAAPGLAAIMQALRNKMPPNGAPAAPAAPPPAPSMLQQMMQRRMPGGAV